MFPFLSLKIFYIYLFYLNSLNQVISLFIANPNFAILKTITIAIIFSRPETASEETCNFLVYFEKISFIKCNSMTKQIKWSVEMSFTKTNFFLQFLTKFRIHVKVKRITYSISKVLCKYKFTQDTFFPNWSPRPKIVKISIIEKWCIKDLMELFNQVNDFDWKEFIFLMDYNL